MVQDDALFPCLTTRETLMFSARLRLPGSMSYQEKAQRVDSLIQQLGLVSCADTYVGDQKVRSPTSLVSIPCIVQLFGLCANFSALVY